MPGGLTAEMNAEIANQIQKASDYISLHMGAYWRFHKLIAPSDDPLGLEMKANNQITPLLTKPVMVTGRIMTLDHASALISSGEADMVSMVRALIADPNLVNKARAGTEEKIRPCIGSNMGCVGQLMTTGRLGCVVNSAAGRERTTLFDVQEKADIEKKILVVGGGPAGLEFARAAALRGHQVELHDAMSRLGGQVLMASSAPHRADLGAITDWLSSELDSLGVEVHLNSFVDEELVAKVNPDEVVVAAGSMPNTEGFQQSTPASEIRGFHLPHVYSPWDILGFGKVTKFNGPAVVYDDTGTFEAISISDILLKKGLKVIMVGRGDSIGARLPFPPVTAGAARERLYSGNFDFIGGHHLLAIEESRVEIGVMFTDRTKKLMLKLLYLLDIIRRIESYGSHCRATVQKFT